MINSRSRPISRPFVLKAVWAVLLATGLLGGRAAASDFIRARDGKLFEGPNEFRFLSWNLPNLTLLEDHLAPDAPHAWRWPDAFEITDALATVRQMGGTVARTYVLSVRRAGESADLPRHVLGPNQFNEEAFRTLDLVLKIANDQNVRLIVPFVDNWHWWGGRAEYAAWRGKSKDDFWTDPQVIADFKQTIHFVLTRTNTLTGVAYRNDPAILCWETGNEIDSPAAWTRDIAAYIKSLDPNHLVMDGFNATRLRPESLTMSEVDIVTTHHYPGGKETFAELITANAALAQGRKPYVVGEFGFVATQPMLTAISAIKNSTASGGLLWSLRFHNRDGGFYWHTEPSGGNHYKAFHWPGSPLGAGYDEIPFLEKVREHAFGIRNLKVPARQTPTAPTLRPITNVASISWQGSAGASGYDLERAAKISGPWQTIATNIDDSFTQYRPLFADESTPRGESFYRVRARNSAGVSAPSNIVGPVRVTDRTLVDEMADWSKSQLQQGVFSFERQDCRQAREDAHRVKGHAGDLLGYEVSGSIQFVRLFAFFPGEVSDFKLSVSTDGENFSPLVVQRHSGTTDANDYGYWKSARFDAPCALPNARYLRIEFGGAAQLGRVEIQHSIP
jgi:mannan endo-1,4-beta-mannosidase